MRKFLYSSNAKDFEVAYNSQLIVGKLITMLRLSERLMRNFHAY